MIRILTSRRYRELSDKEDILEELLQAQADLERRLREGTRQERKALFREYWDNLVGDTVDT